MRLVFVFVFIFLILIIFMSFLYSEAVFSILMFFLVPLLVFIVILIDSLFYYRFNFKRLLIMSFTLLILVASINKFLKKYDEVKYIRKNLIVNNIKSITFIGKKGEVLLKTNKSDDIKLISDTFSKLRPSFYERLYFRMSIIFELNSGIVEIYYLECYNDTGIILKSRNCAITAKDMVELSSYNFLKNFKKLGLPKEIFGNEMNKDKTLFEHLIFWR